MKSSYTKKITAVSAAALLAVAGATSSVFAQVNPGNPATFSATADVTIATLITVASSQNLNFGSIAAPNSGSTQQIVTTAGASGGGSDAAQLNSAALAQGIFSVTGTDGQTVNITFANESCTNAGLTLSGLNADNASPVLSGATAVNVGGTLTIASTATTGATTCTYDFIATYA